MKLISCYIENFGKLQAQSFDFSDGFNSVLQKNGYGKTTLANFIKAMFYGMSATTKKDLDQNDRRKYTPWQGGAYGGALCFETNGKSYKVERFFGKKESDDTFVLYDLQTGKQSNNFSENLGVELFGIDANAYEKCTFIPQKELDGGMNESLQSKLLSMFSGIDNSESLESATNIIDEKRAEIKKQNKTGKLYDVQVQIETAEQKIANLKDLEKSTTALNTQIAENDAKIDVLKKEKEEISAKISAVAENEKIIANQKYIQENKARKVELEKQCQFYKKIVGDEKLTIQDVLNVENKNKEYHGTLAKLEAIKSSNQESADFVALKRSWGDNYPTKEEIASAIEQKEKQGKLETEIELMQNSVGNLAKSSDVPKKKDVIVSLCLSAILLVLGVAMLFVNNIVAIVSFVVCAVALGYAGFKYFKHYIEEQTRGARKINAQFEEDDLKKKQDSHAEIKKYLDDFKSKFGIEYELTTSSLSDLLAKVKEYEIALKRQQDVERKTAETENSAKVLLNDMNKFFARFAFPENLQKVEEKLALLREICTVYPKLIDEIEAIDKKLAEFGENAQKNSEIANIDKFDMQKLQSEERELQQKIDKLVEIRSDLNNKLGNIQEEVLGLDDLQNDLAMLKEEKEELKYQLKTYEKAKEFLQLANDTLSAKFLAPMKQSLNNYLGKFVSQSELELSPDINMNISFDKNGATRELAYLSKGYKGVVDLCIRFALVDALFEKEKPFLILDDPFVNLDEEKLASAMKLLKDVAKEYQIIYLVCHNSRA
ncbi:MAG: hypothetical protein IJS74_01930 [Clostridia bacterium]|nr:hypothetical protein [Clostridia bacterium]